ncbi:ribosome assembly factor SBDS [archaeon]|jgi:ribosome maturation protein SDO1|nr:ribosome assembly factor SBDS [archaeon]
MSDTLAKLKSGKLNFETMVDLDSAMKLKKGQDVDINEVIRDTTIYTDQKKGMKAGADELMNTFNTTNLQEITKRIVQKGQLEVTQEYRDEAQEQKKKQIIDFLTRNAIDPRTNRPFTPDILESAIKQAGTRIDNQPIEKQIPNVLDSIKTIIPIKIETKKVKITIPAQHTGQTYGLLQDYKEKEEWLPNGDLEVILNIPVGIQTEFYDKLNSVTHGSAITEEIREE